MDNIVDAIIRDPGKPKPIYRQIVEHLKKRIISSDIKPGQSLPNMSDMVKQWDVGYPTVKSAMQLLEKEGLIRCEAGRGKGPVVLETKKTATECSIIFPRSAFVRGLNTTVSSILFKNSGLKYLFISAMTSFLVSSGIRPSESISASRRY